MDGEEMTLETLSETYRGASGCTRDEAATMLAEVCLYWRCPVAKLPRLVATLAVGKLTPLHVLVWLQVTAYLEQEPNGRELLFAAGLRVADRFGIASEFLDKLREHAPPSPREPRH